MILAPECGLFPERLFEEVDPTDDRSWLLVHTKPRQEKALARHLAGSELHFFLPSRMYRRRAGRRVVTSYLPLFPGYVFVYAREWERPTLYGGNMVVKLLPVADQSRLWGDLRQVHRLLSLGLPVTVEDHLPPGTRVAVRTGPLAGMVGFVVREASENKFVIRVDLIQRGVSVVVEAGSLGKLD